MTILGKFIRRQGRESVVKGRSPSKLTSIKIGVLQRRRLSKVPWRKKREPNPFEMHLMGKERPEVGKETLLAMESQVMDLLRPSPFRTIECSVPAIASALAGSIKVMDTHANNSYYIDTNNNNDGRSKDSMFSITRHLTNLRFLSGGAQKESLARRYELITALNNLEKDPATMNTKVTSWLEARDILATVLKLPVDAEGETTTIVPIHASFTGRELALAPIPSVEEKDEVDKFFLRLEEKTRKAREEELKPSSTKWKQIIHHRTPPPLGQEAVGEGQYLVSSLEKADKEFEFTLQRHTDSHEARIKSQAVAEVEERLKEEEARKLASSLMRPLTSEENAVVRNAMYGIGPDHEILAQVGSDSVQRGSIHCLQPGQWLNDEVIHYFYVMLAARDEEMCQQDSSRKRSHFFKSFFMTKLLNEGNTNLALDGKYDYRNVKRWSKNAPGKDIFKLDKIFFPINEGRMHWICAVAFVQERRIQMYDSMGSDGMHYIRSIFQYIKDEHQDKKKTPLPDADDWELVPCTRETPRQRNGYDCGVFTCMFADFLSKDCPLLFSQEHVNQCRDRICLSIMNGKAIL